MGFLQDVYENNLTVRAGYLQGVPAKHVAEQIGLKDRAEVDRILTYLNDGGLIKFTSIEPSVAITKYGIDEVEEAIANPDAKTAHFLPINIIHISGNATGSAIQVGTAHSTQTVTTERADWTALAGLMSGLRDAHPATLPDDGRRATAAADLDAVEAQLKLPTPRAKFVRECLLSVRKVLESAAGSTVARELGTWLNDAGWQ